MPVKYRLAAAASWDGLISTATRPDADYPFTLSERFMIRFVADFFNVTNNRDVRLPDQNRQTTGTAKSRLLETTVLPAAFQHAARLEAGVLSRFQHGHGCAGMVPLYKRYWALRSSAHGAGGA